MSREMTLSPATLLTLTAVFLVYSQAFPCISTGIYGEWFSIWWHLWSFVLVVKLVGRGREWLTGKLQNAMNIFFCDLERLKCRSSPTKEPQRVVQIGLWSWIWLHWTSRWNDLTHGISTSFVTHTKKIVLARLTSKIVFSIIVKFFLL